MAKNTKAVVDQPTVTKSAKSGKNRYASKKAYFARNANGSISKKNKARRAAADAKRKAYWTSFPGQTRKESKMNTPEKLKAREVSKVARNARRRQRKLDEQSASRNETLKNEGGN